MRVFFIRFSFFVSQRLVSNFFPHFYMYFIKMCLSMSDFLYGANVLCFSGRCQLSFFSIFAFISYQCTWVRSVHVFNCDFIYMTTKCSIKMLLMLVVDILWFYESVFYQVLLFWVSTASFEFFSSFLHVFHNNVLIIHSCILTAYLLFFVTVVCYFKHNIYFAF